MENRDMRRIAAKIRGLATAVQSQLVVARLLIQIEKLETRSKERIERIKEEKEERIKVLRERIAGRSVTLFSFFEAQRDQLPSSGKGSVAKTDVGACEWYPGANSIEVTDEEAAIAELERREVAEALRVKTELNKEYLLEHPGLVEEIPGIRIVQRPKRILRFEDTKARIELPEDEPVMEIVFPKKKK